MKKEQLIYKKRTRFTGALAKITLVLGVPIYSQAQINLDRPIMVGAGDQVYAAYNSDWYYFFPRELCRVSSPSFIQQHDRLFANFSVSLCERQVTKVKEELAVQGIPQARIRTFQGINSTISAMSLTEIYQGYDPKIEVLSDPGDFAALTPYRMSLYSGTRARSIRRTQSVMSTLFGPESIDAYVQINFDFSAIFGGVQRQCMSAVSVYVGRDQNTRVTHSKINEINFLAPETNPILIIEDKMTPCWTNPRPGVICLK